MFKFKRNFSIRESPRRCQTPGSPIKFTTRLIDHSNSGEFVRICQTPVKTSESAINQINLKSPVKFFSRFNPSTTPINSSTIQQPENQSPTFVFETSNGNNISLPMNDPLESTANGYQRSNLSESEPILELPKPKRVRLSLEQIKLNKEKKLTELKQQISDTLKEIKLDMEETRRIRRKRFTLENHMSTTSRCLVEVRNQLNQIFNPGNGLAQTAKNLMEEKRELHGKRFEALSFDMDELIENAKTAIDKKKKQITHETEIHERTLMTIESRNKAVGQEIEADVQDKSTSEIASMLDVPKSTSKDGKKNRSVTFDDDDDCVIIGEESNMEEELDLNESESVDVVSKDPSIQESIPERSMSENNQDSDTTNIVEDEDEQQTDIDEDAQAQDEERSFTPCQAQRLV